MALDSGGVPLGQGEHPHIGQNDCVHPHVVQILQPLGQPGCLVIAGHGVAGDVDPHPVAVAQRHGGFQLLRGEVAGEGAHSEGVARQIDRVSPIGHRHVQPLHVPGGGEQLNVLSFQVVFLLK